MPRTPYDVNASWDDPFDRPKERRVAPRTPARFQIKIAVALAHKRAPLVGAGNVQDMSVSGMRCLTKHRLAPGQPIKLLVPTTKCPSSMGLPNKFLGGAQVVRSTLGADGVSEVALRFDEDIRDDIQLAVFVDHLSNLARAASA